MSQVYPDLSEEMMEANGDGKPVNQAGAGQVVIPMGNQQQGAVIQGGQEDKEPEFSTLDMFLIYFSILISLLIFPLSIFAALNIVQEYERAIIFRLGKLLGGPKGPGLFWIVPCTDDIRTVDMRTKTFDIPPQEILTRDSVTVQINAVVYYRIQDARMSIANVDDVDGATRLLAQTTLRNVMGTRSLAQVMTDRENISSEMSVILDNATDVWGIKVERVEVKDVRLPYELQRAMAAEAEAAREAKAKVIAAEGEMNSSMKLKEAADVMADAPNAIQLRYLQTLTSICAEKNSTIIFPLPMEIMGKMTK